MKKEVLTVDVHSREERIFLFFLLSTQVSKKKEILPVDLLTPAERELSTNKKKYPNPATQERANVSQYGHARVHWKICNKKK